MAQGSLSPQDLDHLRAELAEGRQPAVWFTSAAVGVETGRSAKVISFTEPEEGDFIQVRPTGDRDEISFSPAELTTEKPPRKKAPAAKPPVKEAEPEKPAEIEHVYTPAPPPVVEKPKPAPAKPAPAARKGAKPAEVTITLTSTIEGEWAAEVLVGVKRTLRQAALTPSAVAQAAKLLHPEVAAAVDAVLTAARETHLARVEQLRAELEVAQRALDELSG
ncbi:DUF6319 family protein [Umezawaea tangerina]|uniref:Translation initiation factor n=1 Tax=Umezawaea tangerina TaxID=84725 RepID=A0A2T0SC22_9PSEU|nr:DUF6319 family protein [Umezawaea tangerina]PRY30967.1 hypothetical protein CLV43_12369 [Umezawaea tangerina]